MIYNGSFWICASSLVATSQSRTKGTCRGLEAGIEYLPLPSPNTPSVCLDPWPDQLPSCLWPTTTANLPALVVDGRSGGIVTRHRHWQTHRVCRLLQLEHPRPRPSVYETQVPSAEGWHRIELLVQYSKDDATVDKEDRKEFYSPNKGAVREKGQSHSREQETFGLMRVMKLEEPSCGTKAAGCDSRKGKRGRGP